MATWPCCSAWPERSPLGRRRAAVVGLVNMNMLLIDVTELPQAAIDDEVVLIGRQKRQHISVASFSELSRHLNYEVLVRLPSEIPRVVVD